MNPQTLQEQLETTQAQLTELQEKLAEIKRKIESITIENAEPGDTLSDGCIIVHRLENLVLIAAPTNTEVYCERGEIYERAFVELESKGFNMLQWHIPTANELTLAASNCPSEFVSGYYFWSSEFFENSQKCPLAVRCQRDCSTAYVVAHTDKYRVRAFRWVILPTPNPVP